MGVGGEMGVLAPYAAYPELRDPVRIEEYKKEYDRFYTHCTGRVPWHTLSSSAKIATAGSGFTGCKQCWVIRTEDKDDWCLIGLLHILELKRMRGLI